MRARQHNQFAFLNRCHLSSPQACQIQQVLMEVDSYQGFRAPSLADPNYFPLPPFQRDSHLD